MTGTLVRRGRGGYHALCGVFFLFCSFSFLPLWAKNATRDIESSCKILDSAIKGDPATSGVTSQYLAILSADTPEEWKSFNTEADLQTACPKGCFEKAVAYYLSGTLVLTSLELKGPTKEWVHYLKFYYRQDGTLEKIHSDFRRFGAYEKDKGTEQQFLVKVIRDRYYDSRGKSIKKTRPRYFNTSNGRELQEVVFTDVPWPFYPDIGKLPFYSLTFKPAPSPSPIP